MDNLERSWKSNEKSWNLKRAKEYEPWKCIKMPSRWLTWIYIVTGQVVIAVNICFFYLSLVVSGDQTEILRAGYWPSYNVPFYEQVVHYCSHSSTFDVKISSSLSGATTLRSRETWNACAWDCIACATDETKLTLFKTVCETAPKSLFWVPTCVPGFEYASWLAF